MVAAALAAALGVAGGCATAPETLAFEPRPAARVSASALPRAAGEAYRDLVGPTATPTERLTAARRLLSLWRSGGEGSGAAGDAVASALAVEQEPAVHRAMLDALAAADAAPEPALAPRLAALLGEVDPAVSPALADAIGRDEDPAVRDYLVNTASSPQATVSARSDAARALGRVRTKRAAATLMQLTDPGQPEVVRAAAFEALGVLTGEPERGGDRAAWAAWWADARTWPTERWYRHLLGRFVRGDAAQALGRDHLEARLVESQGALYRTTSPEDRPAVLAYMLGDPLLPIRQLAMELSVARLLDDQRFDEPLRQALRDRLTDPSAGLREGAALLLRDLADEPAAAIAARRLAAGRESATSVRQAYLRLLARLPQAAAVGPALEMLGEPPLRGEAAGALAASVDAGHLSAEQARLAAQRVRAALERMGGREPAPQVVTLLGKVGDDEDFDRIARWVDSSDTAVKRAAAQAWADSERSLRLLAERAGDATIAPIAIEAAIRRGDDPRTLEAVLKRRPEPGQLRAAWERAVVAMASRVPASAVLRLLPELDAAGDDPTLRERVLSSALEAETDAELPTVDAVDPAKLALRLERGETRLTLGEPAAAIEDFERLGRASARLSDRQADRLGRGWIRAALALGRFDEAFEVASRLLGEAGPTDVMGPTDDPIVDLFIEAAKRQVRLGQRDQARAILTRLRELLGPRIKPEVAQRMRVVEAEIGAATPVNRNGP